MNHYPHRVGDFDAATRHLSRLERAIYRDMRDRYCLTESPLDGNDFDLLARRLLCVTPEEVAALQFVLDEFFELTSDGFWVNHECDQIIAAYRAQQAGNGIVKSNEKDRKARSRSRRSAMFSALRGVGVVLPYNTKMAELYRLCKDHKLTISEDAPVTEHAVTGDVTGHGQVTDGHALGTGKPEPKPKPINPPNPPAGGAGGGLAIATALSSHFPEHRRTRIAEVAAFVVALEAGGEASGQQLLDAAALQAEQLAKDGGKHAPNVLTWLRRRCWLDSAALPAGGGLPLDWSATRSGIEAMGARLGLPPWEASGYRLLADYEAEVRRLLDAQGVAV